MAHSNYAKDRDLMQEAYSSVQGAVPKTSTTALPRGYVLTESSCNSEHEEHSHEDAEFSEQDPYESYLKDLFAQEYGSDPAQFENFIDDISDTIAQKSERDFDNPDDVIAQALKQSVEMGLDLDEAIEQQQDDLKRYSVEDGEHEDGEHEKPVGSGKKSYEHLGYGRENGEHPAEDGSCATHSDEEHGDDTVKLDLDHDTAEKLHDQLMAQLGLGDHPAEDSSCMSDEEHKKAEDGE